MSFKKVRLTKKSYASKVVSKNMKRLSIKSGVKASGKPTRKR